MALFATATGIAAAAVTLTLPQTASARHRITQIQVDAYTTVARNGTATPVVVTTTNLNGLAFTFGSAGAVGAVERDSILSLNGVDADVANTATTIVCPATASVIWRVNVVYENVG